MIDKPRLRIIFRPEGFYIHPINQPIMVVHQLVLNQTIEVLKPNLSDKWFVVNPHDHDMRNGIGVLFKR